MSSDRTRALVVTEHGDASVLAVCDVDLAEPGDSEVRVRVAAVGVNFIDVYKRKGVYPGDTPFVAGEEGAGEVVAVGNGVSDIAVGDVVAWGFASHTAAAEVNVPVSRLVRVPAATDPKLAAAAMLQGMTAQYLVTSTWPLQDGQIALVHAAAGGVGQLLVQMCTARGATVVATAGSPEKLAIAERLGATHLVDYTDYDGRPDDLAARVRELAGRGVDVAYDGVGRATYEASLGSLRPRGLLALYGAASGPVPPIDPMTLNRQGSLFLTRPTLADYVSDPAEFAQRAGDVFSGLAAGSLRIEIGGEYSFDDAAAAYEALEGRRSTGKLLLIP